jgi:SAM-dependent methyltransferase
MECADVSGLAGGESRMSRKSWVPWYAKIAAKLVLSRLPAGYGIWRKLNLFAHGAMHKPDYAYGVFRQHFERSNFSRKKYGFIALEVGPGDSLFSAILASAHGASRCYLIDTGPFATVNLTAYREMVEYLRLKRLPVPAMDKVFDLAGVLQSCNSVYGTQGLRSLREIPSESVDFIWSQAAFEHIRRYEFLDTMRELRRVLRTDGVCSHRIDLKDHLGGALNNMRFPTHFWEADWMAQSGFYTNRLRYSEMIELFRQAGFAVEVVAADRWTEVPTPHASMAKEFRGLSYEDLLVKEFDVLLRPA